jgi:asparagine synthase (glutamine-hydrolysing)
MSEQFLPHDIIYRKKLGFSSPLEEWWRLHLAAWLRSLVNDGGGWLNYPDADKVRQVIRVHESGRQDLKWQMLFLINFVLWHMRWIEGRTDLATETAAVFPGAASHKI